MRENNGKETILIIGDWFLDENWLLAKQNTTSSSHTGDIHYLSKHTEIDKRMISLCGASEILEVLRLYFKESNKYSFIGYGVWNLEDDDILQCTLCSENIPKKHLTPFTIKNMLDIPYEDDKRICPYNENPCVYNPHLKNLAKGKKVSTNRIIRRYEGYGSGMPHLLDRTDWQLPISNADLTHKAFIELKNKNITAIVVEDHGKGVINEKTIRALIKNLGQKVKDIRWYIRTKIDNPKWMKILYKNNIKIRLKVLDFKLAFHKKGQRRWLFGNELGHASLELLGELTGDKVYKHGKQVPREKEEINNTERVAMLFADNTAIAKCEDKCFNLNNPPGPRQLINIGRTTMFFNALIAQDLSDDYKREDFGTQCFNALHCAFDWSKEASIAWNQEKLHFYGNYKTALKKLKNKSLKNTQHELTSLSYNEQWEKWNKSSIGFGVIEMKNNKVFQLWRGEGALEGFTTVGSPKRSAINDLITKIHHFQIQKNPKYPFNCLLISSPGWGKSFLAKCMANHFDMYYMEFSLSQMASNRDLIECFDSICSIQNKIQKKALIFMDEINCEIEGHSALELLLSPIWDGTFIRDGKFYRLLPAVWIFASTEQINELISPKKGSDFISRLNGPIIELDSLATEGDRTLAVPLKELKRKLVSDPNFDPYNDPDYEMFKNLSGAFKTEQVYLGVSLLNNIWGPISNIQEEVLKLFHSILPINGFRSLEFLISKFQNIHRSVVVCSNVPTFEDFKELNRHIVIPEEWSKGRPADNMRNLIKIEALVQ